MIRCAFAIPGDLASPTGGYTYARKVLPLLAETIDISVCSLPGNFPFPSEGDLRATSASLKICDGPDKLILFDGLAYGAIPLNILRELDARIVALVHHPLGFEQGLSEEQKRRLLEAEKNALALANQVIVSSGATASVLAALFDIPQDRITVAEPGILRGERAPGTPPGQPLHIVSVGAVTPRKGFEVLVDALDAVWSLEWRATIAGALDRSPGTVTAVRNKIADFGLSDRVKFVGSMDEGAISSLYASGDIFALASYYEGYGMAFAEAMAHGLPIVASGDGAVKDTVPEAAGVICPAGDARSFAGALHRMLSDPPFRKSKAEGAWRYGQTLPDWRKTASIIADVLKRAAA